MNIKKGDKIKMRAGKDRGKTGGVIRVLSEEGRIVAEGLNLVKKHVRPRKTGEKGQTVLVPRPFPASRAALLCPHCGRATRIGHRVEGGKKVRYCKKCEAAL